MRSKPQTLRATNVIARLHEEFRREVKTQGALPTEDTALVLLSLVASGIGVFACDPLFAAGVRVGVVC